MTKRILLVAAASLSLLAGAAVAHAATKHKATFTSDAHVLRSANNVTTWTGTVDGKLGHGAVVLTTMPAGDHFEFAARALFPNGSIRVTGTDTAAQNPDGTFTFTGKLTVKSGTGKFKGAKGSATLSGATTAEDPARALYTITGTLTY
jgi:lipopolysaccharide export system protein LptA